MTNYGRPAGAAVDQVEDGPEEESGTFPGHKPPESESTLVSMGYSWKIKKNQNQKKSTVSMATNFQNR